MLWFLGPLKSTKTVLVVGVEVQRVISQEELMAENRVMLRNMPKSMEWPCSSSKKRLPPVCAAKHEEMEAGGLSKCWEREKKVIRQFCELSPWCSCWTLSYIQCLLLQKTAEERTFPTTPTIPQWPGLLMLLTGCVNIVTFDLPQSPTVCLNNPVHSQKWNRRSWIIISISQPCPLCLRLWNKIDCVEHSLSF